MHTVLIAVLAVVSITAVRAQDGGGAPASPVCQMSAGALPASSATIPSRSALSAAEEDRLLAGDGAGQAGAAEMNGYPGPRHVLDQAAALQLTAAQRATIQDIFTRMNADARRLGAGLVQAERELYGAFHSGTATAETLDVMTAAIGRLQAEIRARHLKAHLDTKAVLTLEQLGRYVPHSAHPH